MRDAIASTWHRRYPIVSFALRDTRLGEGPSDGAPWEQLR
jgi:hypothetical protein